MDFKVRYIELASIKRGKSVQALSKKNQVHCDLISIKHKKLIN